MTTGYSLAPLRFEDLAGWARDDHAAALAAFRLSAAGMATSPPKTRALGVSGNDIAAVGALAIAAGAISAAAARRFLETHFVPHEVRPATGAGFYTGYYEPDVRASRHPRDGFTTPLYRRPDDLVDVDDGNRPAGWDPAVRFGRRNGSGLTPYPDRGEIQAGALAGRGLELAYLENAVEAFFIHVQGSARLRLAEGGVMRLTYAAKAGHAYTPIGRVLLERGALPRHDVNMASIRAWLHAHPDEAPAVMAANRSYIFFREAPVDDETLGPVAAAGVPLSPGRSLAVDRTLHTFHTPVWVETRVPAVDGSVPFSRLMIAQDTGSAIVGPARGDIFFGSGDAAGALAGPMQAEGRFVVLVPRPEPLG